MNEDTKAIKQLSANSSLKLKPRHYRSKNKSKRTGSARKSRKSRKVSRHRTRGSRSSHKISSSSGQDSLSDFNFAQPHHNSTDTDDRLNNLPDVLLYREIYRQTKPKITFEPVQLVKSTGDMDIDVHWRRELINYIGRTQPKHILFITRGTKWSFLGNGKHKALDKYVANMRYFHYEEHVPVEFKDIHTVSDDEDGVILNNNYHFDFCHFLAIRQLTDAYDLVIIEDIDRYLNTPVDSCRYGYGIDLAFYFHIQQAKQVIAWGKNADCATWKFMQVLKPGETRYMVME